MGLGDPARMAKYQKDNFPDYTPEQLGAMAETYSPEQLEAIRAGEAAVDTRDFAVQGRLRDDMFRPRYFDDFRMMHPEYDLKPEAEVEPEEPNWLGEEAYIRAYEKKMLDLMGKSMDNHLSRSLLRAMRTVKATPAGQDTLDLTGEEIEELLRAVADPAADPLAEARRELKTYLLGPDEPTSMEQFDAAVQALAAKAEARNAGVAQRVGEQPPVPLPDLEATSSGAGDGAAEIVAEAEAAVDPDSSAQDADAGIGTGPSAIR